MQSNLILCRCGKKLTVVESRQRTIGGVHTIWRRKKCPEHGGRITTLELDELIALEVLQDD
jgi:transcriptional regulator NrdR family protein